jgi:hypothetical protein
VATEALPREPAASSSGGSAATTPAPGPGDGEGPSGGRGPRRGALVAVAVVAALLALLSAAALPFAPVRHDRPVVTWPQSAAAPVSTSLMLVAHRPAALSASTTCATARAAAERGDGLILSTMRPSSALAAEQGLLWWVSDGQLRLDVAGTLVDSQPLPAGDCALEVVTTDDGLGVALLRDGTPVGEPTEVLPEVDSLVTSLTALDEGAGERLSATVAVNDEFASSPTPVKLALVALLLLAGLACLLCLGLLDRTRAGSLAAGAGSADHGLAPPPWRSTLRPRLADAAVVVLVVAWTFLAPMTDDDGYYAAMARNVAASGYVGQYYQLYDQSFVPLTWPWYALSWWTGVADTPLGLRVPALVLGLLTWLGVRRCADLLLGDHPRWGRSGRVRGRVTALLALAFATAWTPYVMGVRPEAISAAASVAVLVGVLTTLRTGRQLPLALAVVAAALSCAAHPTGAVAVAPLLAATPQLWRRLRSDRPLVTLARLVTVIAPGAMATAAGFADGTLHDFRRGREVFTAIERPLEWTQEIRRYEFLFNQGIPMGAYAKRTVVVLALLAVGLSLLLVAAARARRLAEASGTAALATTATTALLAFVTLWVTPSKWTHHFGSLAGLAPLLLTVLLLVGPQLARRALPGGGRGAAGFVVVASVVAVAAVAMSGPNLWPYAYDLGMPHPGVTPYLSVVDLSSPVWWALGAAVTAAGLALLARRRARGQDDESSETPGAEASETPDAETTEDPGVEAAEDRAPSSVGLRTAAVTTVALMAVSTSYLVGSFAIATAATRDAYSPSAAMVTDPLNRDCGAAGAISVADGSRAQPLAPAPGLPATPAVGPEEAFVEGTGWWQGDPPPGTLPPAQSDAEPAPVTGTWGSLADGDTATGELLTGWYALGDALAGAPGTGGAPAAPDAPATAVTVLVSGDLVVGGGNTLVAEYGVVEGDDVRVTTVEQLADDASSTEWRTVRLGDAAPVDPGPDGVVDTDDDPPPVPVLAPQGLTADAAGVPADPAEEGLVYDQELAAAAQVVRLRAVDGTSGSGGWLAVGTPGTVPVTTMAQHLPDDAVVATAWQRTYLFPCQEQVLTAHGISTRPEHAILYGSRSLEGTGDSVWQPGRGGLFAQVPEAATLTQVSSWFTDTPEVPWGQLASAEYAYPERAYDLALSPEVTSGLTGPSTPPLS